MKTKHPFLLALIPLVMFVNSCKEPEPVPPKADIEVSPSDANAMSEILVFPNATTIQGSDLPQSSPISEAPVLSHFDNNVSYTAGSKITLPVEVTANSTIAGVYIQVKGASKYFDVPINSSSTKATISIPFNLPSIVKEGTFIILLKFYDTNKKISLSREISITVTKTYKCGITKISGGEGLTSTLFIVPNTAGKIKISYETYNVKDKIDVFQNGNWIGGTGPYTDRSTLRKALDCSVATEGKGYVGKKDEFLFDYNPINGLEIEVVVSGCEDGGTKWEYTFSCPGATSSINLDLNGKWLSAGGNGLLISGTSGNLYLLNSTWQGYQSKGLVNNGDLCLKNISKISTYKWNCLDITMYIKGGVPTQIVWADNSVLTMNNDGKTMSISSNYTLPSGTPSSSTTNYTRQ